MLKKYFPKLVIVLVAVFLRFWDLSGIPSGLYVDEAVQGYNAYSLGITGRDHYGQAFPLATKMFATYSAPLYTYYSVLPVKILGLNQFSVRLTASIMGILLVVVTLFYFGNFAGLITAIAPVFVFFSRGAFEANLGLFMTVLSFILFRRSKFSLAFLFLSLSAYAYHAQKLLFLPVFIFYLYKSKNYYYSLLLILIAPLFYLSLFTRVDTRAAELITTPQIFVHNILVYLSPDNLFSRPDPDLQRSFPELSVFYWWMIIPLIFGFIKVKNKLKIFLLFLLLLTPGALTKDYFSTIRVLSAFYLLLLIIGQGFAKIHKFSYLLSCILCLLSLFELYSNLILLKYERSAVWGYQYGQLFSLLEKKSDQQILVDISRQKPLYILLAFYQQLDPKELQSILYIKDYYQNTQFSPEFKYQNITLKTLDWKKDLAQYQLFAGDLLTISSIQAHEHGLHPKEIVFDLTDRPALQIWSKD